MSDIDDPSMQAWLEANPAALSPPGRRRCRHRAVPLLVLASVAVALGSGVVAVESESASVVDAGDAWISQAPASTLVITLEFARPMRITEVWFSPGVTVSGLHIIEKS